MLTGLENPMHLLIIAIVVLLVFGPKRLPQIGRQLGSGIRQFREGISSVSVSPDEPETPSAPPKTAERAPDRPAGRPR